MNKWMLLLAGGLTFFTSMLHASIEESVDLAGATTRQEFEVEAKEKITLTIKNMRYDPAGEIYTVSRKVFKNEISPLKLMGEGSGVTALSGNKTEQNQCQNFNDSALDKLKEVAKEVEIQAKIKELNGLFETQCKDVLDNNYETKKKELNKALTAATTMVLDVSSLKQDYATEVTVSRKKVAGETQDRLWSVVFVTESGNWEVQYGFIFTKDKDEDPFINEVEVTTDATTTPPTTETQHQVMLSANESRDLKFMPTIMYGWVPDNPNLGNGWSHGFSAGLGYDGDNFGVLAGWAFHHRKNISIQLGALVQERERLKGRYSVGQDVGSNVDEDSLTETVMRASWYLGLGFRFGSDPKAHWMRNHPAEANVEQVETEEAPEADSDNS